MATGKTHARFVRVKVDDSGGTPQTIGVGSIDTIGEQYDEQDVTAFSDGVHNFVLGHPEAPLEITGPFDNTATSGAHTVLSGIVGDVSTTYTVTVEIGIRAAPTVGDPKWEGEYYCSQYNVNVNDASYTARFVPASEATSAPAWGSV